MIIDNLRSASSHLAIGRMGLDALLRWRPGETSTTSDILRLPSSTNVLLSDDGRRQSILAELGRNVAGLVDADAVAPFAGRPADTGVLASASNSGGVARTVDVDVRQIATAQTLQSARFADEDRTIIGTGSLTFRFGSINPGVNSFLPDQRAPATVVIRIDDGTLGGIANAINRAGTGVLASTVDDAGGSRLQIRGRDTGRDQAFQIDVADDDGNSIDDVRGLSRLAFQPVEPVGYGRNLLQIQAAADTELHIGERSLSSASSRVRDNQGLADFEVAAPGQSSVDFGREADTAVKSARTLVDSFNRARQQLAPLDQSGEGGVLDQLDLAAASASDRSAARYLTGSGVERLADGRLSLDEGALRKAFVESADSVSEVLGNFGQRLAALSEGNNANATSLSWQQQLQSLFGTQPTLLAYSPTTRSVYGLAQYLTVARL
ncbi:hypothetical protein [Chitinimonas lacunae]|uniref:Flagellar hook-associated protein 2 C-terminal domain-containing protein n=1 Tax=Chitinimonas lacunae TaxID=1963018 RepID=A0ABV8MM63_9NEIS